MEFFTDWNDDNYQQKLWEFISKSQQSEQVFKEGDRRELDKAYQIIKNIKLEAIMDCLKKHEIKDKLDSSEIPQFSTFEDGAQRVSELLEFEPSGMGYVKLGYQLKKPDNDSASRKYGENHSKLARSLGLAEISKTRPAVVTPTAWGRYLVSYSISDKEMLLKNMLCREAIVQKIMKEAELKDVEYCNVVNELSITTQVRRRSNIKEIMEYILTESSYEYLLSRIKWTVGDK